MKPLRRLASLGVMALIMVAAWTIVVLKSGRPAAAWQRHLNDFSNPDVQLLQGGSDEVVMVWSPQPNWTANVTINLKHKTMLGGAGNGVSFSAPYPDANPEDNTLTDEQISEIQQTLVQLPESARVDPHADFFHEFRVAYFQDGIREIRYYPSTHLPRPLKKIGDALHLWLPEQAQE